MENELEKARQKKAQLLKDISKLKADIASIEKEINKK